ncbi:glycoside hydrolase family 2 TIM barrel-domain containing protein [Tenuifilum thalassicum]|uniref:Glycoside hydrolase family 2 protein n=1 Tax=Tenuifilum thalassicum TaxID=2590900 RepID=A0A7D3Y055_9BACT|nr:glycoside hydrolase family 2 TIM barrel-domain containing protein [Tenuifilum thalassicum]QKG80233.1 glycoside hydrolase family 2 protein [Tenuifilum thalassicum]
MDKNSPSLSRKYHNKVPIAFRCDNSRDLNRIPSDLNDFPIYGGLFRKIVIKTKPLRFLDSIKITPIYDSLKSNGRLNIIGKVNSKYVDTLHRQEYIIKGSLLNKDSVLISFNFSFHKDEFNISIDSINNLKLWSPSNPFLYDLKLSLSYDNKNSDSLLFRIGFRYFKFLKNGPFYLNGSRLLLKGVHLHEDHSGVGAAVPYEIHEKEIKMIKKMGANFIRLAHYQQSEEVLNLCDKYGLLVWEEVPWSRGGLGGTIHKNNIIEFLSKMIEQHYNHVSIIIWGLGNEIDLTGDFNYNNKDSIKTFLSYLNRFAKQKDPYRMTAIRRCDFAKYIPDIYSPSIWSGWYNGTYRDYEKVIKKRFYEVNHFIHAEWGVGSLYGRHSTDPYLNENDSLLHGSGEEKSYSQLFDKGEMRYSKDGDWSETYACDLVDWYLHTIEQWNWFTGALYWSFKDFATPLRENNPIPHVNLKGIVQRDLTPKEIYYVFQSHWAEEPVLHIYGHTWKNRWYDKLTDSIPIKVYSNCKAVELFVNGKSKGLKNFDINKFPASGFEWKLKCRPGNYFIKAIGHTESEEILVDSINFSLIEKNWGKPIKFKIHKEKISDDILLVKVELVDKKGKICYDARNIVTFDIAGKGELIKNLGTVNGSKKIELANGVAEIYIKLNKGRSVVAVMSKVLKLCL